ncbi:hypothetical protein HDV05_000391, partial [Chytridiales sp. JEL 0842]
MVSIKNIHGRISCVRCSAVASSGPTPHKDDAKGKKKKKKKVDDDVESCVVFLCSRADFEKEKECAVFCASCKTKKGVGSVEVLYTVAEGHERGEAAQFSWNGKWGDLFGLDV